MCVFVSAESESSPPPRRRASPCLTESFLSFSSCFAPALDCARILATAASHSAILAVSLAARSRARRSGSPPAPSILVCLDDDGGGVEASGWVEWRRLGSGWVGLVRPPGFLQ